MAMETIGKYLALRLDIAKMTATTGATYRTAIPSAWTASEKVRSGRRDAHLAT
jgi:hypothetical protein